ncbi:MAG: hypothetical protein GY773_17890, partial [Actinomycetia bacterium]|nr:hypothetical protein [Actinomycetes bacterium]
MVPGDVPTGFESRTRTARPGRYGRWLAIIVGVLVLFHLAGGWYFSSEIYSSALEPDPSTTDLDIPVVSAKDGTLTLSTVDGPDELLIPGVWGLEWATGYGQLTELAASDEETEEVTWQLDVLTGSAPQAGELVDLDVKA